MTLTEAVAAKLDGTIGERYVMAINAAARMAGLSDEGWNRRYRESLRAVGLKLSVWPHGKESNYLHGGPCNPPLPHGWSDRWEPLETCIVWAFDA